ncbi:MAG TPA: hypothetical protein VFH88_06705 [Candidatus Krumholzibacteria bacterium]|nr:hypothetical protein [Candidatus Krumholzibacteria bacterium]
MRTSPTAFCRHDLGTTLLAVATLLCAASSARAQDTNYWTLQYGTRGELLGGCVVGSAVDLSATYYNPGSLALVPDPKAILTATVLGMETFKVTGTDPGQDAVTSRRLGPEPSLFAGTLPVHWFGGRWAYSLLTRQKLDVKLTEREGLVIAVDATVDTLSIGGEALFDQNVNEQWGGLTWSKTVNKHIGVGMTLYGVYRSQERSQRQTLEAIGAGGYGASLTDWKDVDFSTFRMLAKLGAEAEFHNTSVGLAFTTRSLQIYGNGSILINRVVIGDVDLNGTSDSHADVTHGKNLDADYRSPFSVAVGASHAWERTSIHATAEYFFSIDPYVVMEAPVGTNSPGVTTHYASYNHALNDVFNWGVGFEKRFSEKTTGYLSFITDRSASRPVDRYDISVSTWDIYHLNGGVAFTLAGTDLTLGGGFAWGKAPLRVIPDSEGVLSAAIVPQDVSYSRIKAILGIAL